MHHDSINGLKIYWPWQSCADAQDHDRVVFCAERSCESYIRATLAVGETASVQSRITYTSANDDRAIHLMAAADADSHEPYEKWAVCVSRGIDIVKARWITKDEIARFKIEMPNPNDL